MAKRKQHKALAQSLYQRQNGLCIYCGCEMAIIPFDLLQNVPRPDCLATKDHMIPLCRGGTDTPDNIVACCNLCNTIKGDLTVEEFVPVFESYYRRKIYFRRSGVLEQVR